MKRDTINTSVKVNLLDTTQVIKSSIGTNHKYLACQVVTVTNETNNCTRVDIGYVRGEDFVPMFSDVNATVGRSVTNTLPYFLGHDEIPAVRVVGGVVGDLIQLHVSGYTTQETSEGE